MVTNHNQGKRTNSTVVSTMKRLRNLGKSVRETAKIVGVSAFTVQKYTGGDNAKA